MLRSVSHALLHDADRVVVVLPAHAVIVAGRRKPSSSALTVTTWLGLIRAPTSRSAQWGHKPAEMELWTRGRALWTRDAGGNASDTKIRHLPAVDAPVFSCSVVRRRGAAECCRRFPTGDPSPARNRLGAARLWRRDPGHPSRPRSRPTRLAAVEPRRLSPRVRCRETTRLHVAGRRRRATRRAGRSRGNPRSWISASISGSCGVVFTAPLRGRTQRRWATAQPGSTDATVGRRVNRSSG